MIEPDVYLLGRSDTEHERPPKQVPELAGETQWLLDQLRLRRAQKRSISVAAQGILNHSSQQRAGSHLMCS